MQNWTFTLLFLFLFSQQIHSQTCLPNGITFERQSQVDSFAINYPGCTEVLGNVFIQAGGSDISNLNGLIQLTAIQGYFQLNGNGTDTELHDMLGLSNLEAISGELRIIGFQNTFSTKGLSQLNVLGGFVASTNGDTIRLLDLEGVSRLNGLLLDSNSGPVQLSGLSNVERITGTLNIQHNTQLVTLEGLEKVTQLGAAQFSSNPKLTDISALGEVQSVSGSFILDNNPAIADLKGLKNVKQIGGGLNIWNCDKILDLQDLKKLESIGNYISVRSNDKLISLNGLENIRTVGGGVDVKGNPELLNISALENIDQATIENLTIIDNPKLAVCNYPNLCFYLSTGATNTISGNGPGCSSINEVFESCEEVLSKLLVQVYYDENQNQIFDAFEKLLPDASVTIDPPGFILYNSRGLVFLPDGRYEVSFNQTGLPDMQLTTDSLSYTVDIDFSNSCDTLYFGVSPAANLSRVSISLNAPPTRCNTSVLLEAHAYNFGTTIMDGILWIETDSLLGNFEFVDQPDTVASNKFGWAFESLYPGHTFSRGVRIQVPGPPGVLPGTTLHFNSYIDYMDINGTGRSHDFKYESEIRCSYDPNDKLVNPAREDNYTLFDETLVYTVRFQNTGNDVAYDVTIRDTLDENLAPESFRVLSTSHPNQLNTTLESGRYLTFSFEEIYLPDSTADFEGSQGYVSYMIDTRDGLDENTLVENTASIYFDLNPPVVTNTTLSVLVSELPVAVHELENGKKVELRLSPNPTNGLLHVSSNDFAPAILSLRNLSGQIVLQQPFQQHGWLDLSWLGKGIYFISLTTNNYVLTGKIIAN